MEVGREFKTGYPCVRSRRDADYVALLPVTKPQARRWIEEVGIAAPDLLERLEVRHLDDRFPPAVASLGWIEIANWEPGNLLGLAATHLSVWDSGEELLVPDAKFPTAASEWGCLVRWLGGRIPTYGEWKRTLDAYAEISTLDILDGVSRLSWDPPVAEMLARLRQLVDAEARGLPLLGSGFYELIDEPESIDREVSGQRSERRPQVAGDSPVWPSLTGGEGLRWRGLRSPTLPVVATRLWYRPLAVRGGTPAADARFEIREAEQRPRTAESARAGGRASFLGRLFGGGKSRRMPAYAASGAKMRRRCPFCHQQVQPEIFDTKASFCCYEERVEIEHADGSKGVGRERRHSVEIHEGSDEVSRQYLDEAQNRPGHIHTVALGGFREAGKTTWLLSLGGMIDYPAGKPALFQAMPKSWSFSMMPCALHGSADQDPTDRKLATERMWLDGRLPVRNSAEEKAIRYPILFTSSPRGKPRELLPIVDDIAGELLRGNLARNENFPHVSSTADAIFFLPADRVAAATDDLTQFIQRMRGAREEVRRVIGTGSEVAAVDLKKINLILVFSKIDQLKYGPPRNRDLLERILPRRYAFPKHRDEEDLKAYVAEMRQVHFAIEEWIDEHLPIMGGYVKQFGSVRYCGLSAFGFQPQKESGLEFEYRLPFAPAPVRVADPLLWLFLENGLIEL